MKSKCFEDFNITCRKITKVSIFDRSSYKIANPSTPSTMAFIRFAGVVGVVRSTFMMSKNEMYTKS
jgi:hypothetical protein